MFVLDEVAHHWFEQIGWYRGRILENPSLRGSGFFILGIKRGYVMKLTGAQILCEALKSVGVDCIFGHPGGAILPFYDALTEHTDIRHVLTRHEQSAAHAAEGYARATDKVGVCVATSGPGATNLITGLAAAKMDSVPIVAITGQVPRSVMGKEAFQECDTTGIAKPVTKRCYLVLRPEDIESVVHEAFYVAKSGRPGPVLIDIPKDVQAQLTEVDLGSSEPSLVEREYYGSTEALEQAAQLIAQAKQPLILAGHGVLLSQARTELMEIAEKLNIPVINTLHGSGIMPYEHPLHIGMLGMHGLYWCNLAVQQADLILGVGLRFDDRITGRPGTFAPNAKIIHVEIEHTQVSKNVVADVPLYGDAKETLTRLISYVKPKKHTTWIKQIASLRENHPSLDIPVTSELLPQYVLSRINSRIAQQDKQSIVITGVGQHQMWAAQYLNTPERFISSGGLGVMGFEIPAALGAQIGRPDSVVWSIAGDGGIQMTLQEFATLKQENIPVKIALFNNGYLGMVRQWQELFYEKRYSAVPVDSPDYVLLAKAYGFPAIRVTTEQEVDPALEQAESSSGPFLIDFVVRSEENVYPMVPPGSSLAETLEDPRLIPSAAG
jgi:acetolactate synthase-1/2/3 large subunit